MKNLFLALLFQSLAFGSDLQDLHLIGTARLKSGDIFYIESHDFDWVKGQLVRTKTTYKNNLGKSIATLDSDFSSSPYLPDSVFKDFRDQYEYKITVDVQNKKVIMAHRDSEKENWVEKKIPLENNMMIMQGAIFYIKDHFEDLKNHKKLIVTFAIPSRLDTAEIAIEAEPSLQKEKLLVYIKPNSRFLRLLLSETQLTFDATTKRLLEFRGTSNLLDEKDKSQDVVIDYKN